MKVVGAALVHRTTLTRHHPPHTILLPLRSNIGKGELPRQERRLAGTFVCRPARQRVGRPGGTKRKTLATAAITFGAPFVPNHSARLQGLIGPGGGAGGRGGRGGGLGLGGLVG
jgi:hypothetical protein